jgi:branched-subunit amino acid ABC-type transport system permease component
VLVAAVVTVVMKYTDLGKAVRAISQDPKMATALESRRQESLFGIRWFMYCAKYH